MKGFMRWLGRIAGSVISIVLIIVLLPYASRVTEVVMAALLRSGISIPASLDA